MSRVGRSKQIKREMKLLHLISDIQKHDEMVREAARQKEIRELLDTIRALKIIDADSSKQRAKLDILFKSKCQQSEQAQKQYN